MNCPELLGQASRRSEEQPHTLLKGLELEEEGEDRGPFEGQVVVHPIKRTEY